MLLIEYPPCTTCIKAKKWLTAQRADFTARHIKQENPTSEELKRWHALSGQPLRRLFNTSGTLYRELGLKEKLDGMTEEEQFSLLATDGMLVRRPILVTEGSACFGFDEKRWSEMLCSKR